MALASLTLRPTTGEGGLRKLNLSHHDIDDSGGGALAEALRTGRCALEVLDLGDTAFTATGLTELWLINSDAHGDATTDEEEPTLRGRNQVNKFASLLVAQGGPSSGS